MEQSQVRPSGSTNVARGTQDQEFIDQIKSELVEFSTAFSNIDLNKAASFFTIDAHLINPAGVHAMGREQIAQVMRDDLNSFLKGTRNEFKYESSRRITSDLAVVDLSHIAKGGQFQGGQELSLHIVTLMKREGDRWLMLECRPYAFMQAPPTSSH